MLKRRGFIGRCLASVAGLFTGAVALGNTSSKPGPVVPCVPPELIENARAKHAAMLAELRRKNPYDYKDKNGRWNSRSVRRLGKQGAGLHYISWIDQKRGDVILCADMVDGLITDLHAHRCLGDCDPTKPGAPVRCDAMSIDEVAWLLDRNQDRKPEMLNDPHRRVQYTLSAGRIRREAYWLNIGDERLDIAEVHTWCGHTLILAAVQKLPTPPTTEECMYLAYMATGFPEWVQGQLLRGLMALTTQEPTK